MSLAKKTTIGVVWNFAEQFARRGINVVVTLILAYFLAPEDYGLVAMMAVFLALGSTLMDSGFKAALIRMKDTRQIDFDTAFYTNISLGVLSYGVLFVAAPYIAEFYDEPRLVELVRVASLAVIINSFQIVQVATLSRELNFKVQLKANLPAVIISSILTVVLAYFEFGVWVLVTQMLVSSLLFTLFLWLQGLWRPTMSFSIVSLKGMYNFGYKLFLSSILDTVFRNLYVIVIAKIFSASVAGLYFFAEKIKELVISQIVTSVQTVTYPALATMQDDNKRLKEGYKKVIGVTTFLLFPMMLFLAALAEPLFEFFLPQKWWDAVLYLQLMAIAGLMYPLHAINLSILKVKGRSDLFLYLEVVKKILVAVILSVSIDFGIIGILVGQMVSSFLAYVPNSYYSAKLIDYGIKEQIADFTPVMLLSGSVALVIYALQLWTQWSSWIELGVFGSMAVLLYLLGAHILKLQAYEMAKELLMSKMRGRR